VPHNEDYSVFKTANNVHCILYQEEQAGYLAATPRSWKATPSWDSWAAWPSRPSSVMAMVSAGR
jgi:hypothetical protein